eukprot:TRINITY_DN14959_c0_g1_i1.p1 TRINITY_DN14959_c0_g1~~TRINITY_DN14959_c0_g1_i1.p1  ORF type:complete len:121 (-),score=23.21 TRINITY_DN14959_c0_g1_i1:73-435(-)
MHFVCNIMHFIDADGNESPHEYSLHFLPVIMQRSIGPLVASRGFGFLSDLHALSLESLQVLNLDLDCIEMRFAKLDEISNFLGRLHALALLKANANLSRDEKLSVPWNSLCRSQQPFVER